ncbi:MAG: HNH endonuclease [Phycisphaerales bacterium]
MAGHTCYNCVYSCCDPEQWLRCLWAGEPLMPRCANHPWWPGQMREVSGVPCRNYRPKPATPKGDVKLIPVSDGCYAYVEAGDYEWLSGYKWHLENGYAARREKGKTILMHRQIMQPPAGMVVDHIDSNQANNCRFNLRVCTRKENQRNRRKHTGSISSFKGVFYNKRRRKWFSQCWLEGKGHATRYVDDEVEATRAYDRQAVGYFGEFARLNFPEE